MMTTLKSRASLIVFSLILMVGLGACSSKISLPGNEGKDGVVGDGSPEVGTNDFLITAIEPAEGRPGDKFTIKGEGLNPEAHRIYFGDKIIIPIANHKNDRQFILGLSEVVGDQIFALVPEGACDGPNKVFATLRNDRSNSFSFKVLEGKSCANRSESEAKDIVDKDNTETIGDTVKGDKVEGDEGNFSIASIPAEVNLAVTKTQVMRVVDPEATVQWSVTRGAIDSFTLLANGQTVVDAGDISGSLPVTPEVNTVYQGIFSYRGQTIATKEVSINVIGVGNDAAIAPMVQLRLSSALVERNADNEFTADPITVFYAANNVHSIVISYHEICEGDVPCEAAIEEFTSDDLSGQFSFRPHNSGVVRATAVMISDEEDRVEARPIPFTVNIPGIIVRKVKVTGWGHENHTDIEVQGWARFTLDLENVKSVQLIGDETDFLPCRKGEEVIEITAPKKKKKGKRNNPFGGPLRAGDPGVTQNSQNIGEAIAQDAAQRLGIPDSPVKCGGIHFISTGDEEDEEDEEDEDEDDEDEIPQHIYDLPIDLNGKVKIEFLSAQNCGRGLCHVKLILTDHNNQDQIIPLSVESLTPDPIPELFTVAFQNGNWKEAMITYKINNVRNLKLKGCGRRIQEAKIGENHNFICPQKRHSAYTFKYQSYYSGLPLTYTKILATGTPKATITDLRPEIRNNGGNYYFQVELEWAYNATLFVKKPNGDICERRGLLRGGDWGLRRNGNRLDTKVTKRISNLPVHEDCYVMSVVIDFEPQVQGYDLKKEIELTPKLVLRYGLDRWDAHTVARMESDGYLTCSATTYKRTMSLIVKNNKGGGDNHIDVKGGVDSNTGIEFYCPTSFTTDDRFGPSYDEASNSYLDQKWEDEVISDDDRVVTSKMIHRYYYKEANENKRHGCQLCAKNRNGIEFCTGFQSAWNHYHPGKEYENIEFCKQIPHFSRDSDYDSLPAFPEGNACAFRSNRVAPLEYPESRRTRCDDF